jgi:glycosyltransferase involved in cell wall biosynthesis
MTSAVVAVNTLSVNDSNEGTRTMLQRLLSALEVVAPELKQVLVCSQANRHLFDHGHEVVEIPLKGDQRLRRIIHDQFTVPRLIKGRADVLFTPAGVAPIFCATPQVVAVSAHLCLPSCQREAGNDGYGLWHRIYYGPPFRLALRRADQVLGISQFLADGLVRELGVPQEKVESLPLGVESPNEVAPIYGREPIALFVGTLYGYKDVIVAVQAFGLAKDRLPANARLVIAGKDPAHQISALRRAAAAFGVTSQVELRGAVSDEELADLYARSSVLLLPSRCEGFGLTVAEAMGHGIPVVVANATSLPEVAGGAGILVDPGDVKGFSDAMVTVLCNPERHRQMAIDGLARAEELTWEHSAQRLRDVIMKFVPEKV